MLKLGEKISFKEAKARMAEKVNRTSPAVGKVLGMWVHNFPATADKPAGQGVVGFKVQNFPEPWYKIVTNTDGDEAEIETIKVTESK